MSDQNPSTERSAAFQTANTYLDSSPVLNDIEELRNRLSSVGYLYLSRFVPRELVLGLRHRFLTILQGQGWIAPGTDPKEGVANSFYACGNADLDYLRTMCLLFKVEEFHALGQHLRLMDLFNCLFQDHVLLHPRNVVRVFFPHADRFTTRAHQDYATVRGAHETYTAWVPLGDCPQVLGGLQLVPTSHLGGLCPTRPVPDGVGTEACGDFSSRWLGGDFHAGDLLIFHSLTVHRALPNRTNQLRLSVDYRYQPLSLPVHPARFALTDGLRSWESTYEGWLSTHYQYYWQNLPLVLAPSIRALEETSRRRADSRYASVLSDLLNGLASARLRTYSSSP